MTFAEIVAGTKAEHQAVTCSPCKNTCGAASVENRDITELSQSDSSDHLSDVCDDDLVGAIPKDGISTAAALASSSLDDFEMQGSRAKLRMCHIDTFPEQRESDKGRPTIVFDLDETLVYARDGTIRPRPFVNQLLKNIQGRCECIVWTAGVRAYAHRVITTMDVDGVISDCICRHDAWFQQPNGQSYVKDLTLLGRDLSRTIIIENTPDCVVRNPLNSIIVSDYVSRNPTDITLNVINQILDGLIDSELSVPEYLAQCSLLRLETLKNASGDTLGVFMLR